MRSMKRRRKSRDPTSSNQPVGGRQVNGTSVDSAEHSPNLQIVYLAVVALTGFPSESTNKVALNKNVILWKSVFCAESFKIKSRLYSKNMVPDLLPTGC